MSEENVKIVRAVYDPEDAVGVLRDDDLWAAWVERVGPHFHPDFEGYLIDGVGVDGRGDTFSGLNGLREAGLDWFAPMATYRREIKQIIDRGERVLVLVREYARPDGSAGEIVINPAHLLTFRDGKISRSSRFISTVPKPSKPWACRSKTRTPTPEPAGYCAGDVAGERRTGARSMGGMGARGHGGHIRVL